MAAIIKKRFLRTGTPTQDRWQVRVDTQLSAADMLALWIADGTLPIPDVTRQTIGGKSYICRDVLPTVINSQRYLWGVSVDWQLSTNQQPEQGSNPLANGTPGSWLPTVTRRPVTVALPAESLYYEGGYSNPIDAKYKSNTTAGDRSPFTNSATSPFRDQLPPHQRTQSLWTIRWVRATVPDALIAAELSINETDLTFSHRGYTASWDEKTAKIESVQITETKVGTVDYWEIILEILHDTNGHYIEALDQGMMEVINPGEPLPTGGSALVSTPLAITDANKKPITEPVLLDGTGKRLTSGNPIIGKWRDYELVDFDTLPLLKDLVS